MKTFIVTLASGRGIFKLKVTAMSKTRAIAIVMQTENCPSYAILAVNKA